MRHLTFILIFNSFIQLSYAFLGQAVHRSNFPKSICLVEVNRPAETFHCSGILMTNKIVKTAAHCILSDAHYKVRCHSGENATVLEVTSHTEFDHQRIKSDIRVRAYDHAYLKLEHKMEAPIIRTSFNRKEIDYLISTARTCAFFGVGLNHWSTGTGYLHGVSTHTRKFAFYSEGLLQVNDPYGAVSMTGDSGASLLCLDDQELWVNIGTVSAHGWENETYVALNSSLKGEMRPTSVESDSEETYQEFSSELGTSGYKVGEEYSVYPFSQYQYQGATFNLVDRKLSRFIISKMEGEFAIGLLIHNGPSQYYLCEEAISCEETLDNVLISLKNLNIFDLENRIIKL